MGTIDFNDSSFVLKKKLLLNASQEQLWEGFTDHCPCLLECEGYAASDRARRVNQVDRLSVLTQNWDISLGQ